MKLLQQLTLKEAFTCWILIDISEACIKMLLISKKIVLENFLFTFTIFANILEFLFEEDGHSMR